MSSTPTQNTDENSDNNKGPKVLRFLNDYRKELALIKTKSFYANHLCKIRCLEGRLNENRTSCIEQCDTWLDSFFATKKQKNPDQNGAILVSS